MPVAIVTGASKGLGRALALGLARRGWSLVADARGQGALQEAQEAVTREIEPGASALFVQGDVSDPDHRALLVEAARSLGGVDLIVNNASTLGPTPLKPLARLEIEDLRRIYEVNTFAPLALVVEAKTLLEESSAPRVLDISSDASVEAYEGWGGYGSSKAALDHIGAILAVEHPNLRVWTVDPGDMRTEMHQRAFEGEDISDRPLPETVVPRLLSLIEGDLPSGRYRAGDLSDDGSEEAVPAAGATR